MIQYGQTGLIFLEKKRKVLVSNKCYPEVELTIIESDFRGILIFLKQIPLIGLFYWTKTF